MTNEFSNQVTAEIEMTDSLRAWIQHGVAKRTTAKPAQGQRPVSVTALYNATQARRKGKPTIQL